MYFHMDKGNRILDQRITGPGMIDRVCMSRACRAHPIAHGLDLLYVLNHNSRAAFHSDLSKFKKSWMVDV